MNKFISYFKLFRWFATFFLGCIVLLVVPALLSEHRYGDAVLCLAIAVFILGVIFSLSHFFTSMAVSIVIDEANAYFSYSNGMVKTIEHTQIQQITVTPYRYTFSMDDRTSISLLRISNFFSTDKSMEHMIKEFYSSKIKR